MTQEAQRIAIAKACGDLQPIKYKPSIEQLEAILASNRPMEVTLMPDGEVRAIRDYLNDLNACAEMEKALGPNAFNYVRSLEEVVAKAGGWEVRKQQMDDAVVFASAAQRAEAFLRTLGLWQE